MTDKGLIVDSSILMDYFRKTDKSRSRLVSHFKNYGTLYISSITEFEVINDATTQHLAFWDGMLARFTILDFDTFAARKAADIVASLKPKRKAIAKPDLFIAATATVNGLEFDRLNKKHFIDVYRPNLLE